MTVKCPYNTYIPSGYLETGDHAGEMSLFQQLFTEAKVYLVPGSMFSCKIPGWFRIVFAVTPERWDTNYHDQWHNNRSN